MSVVSEINGFKTKICSCEKHYFYLDRIFSISKFMISFVSKNFFNNVQITVSHLLTYSLYKFAQ